VQYATIGEATNLAARVCAVAGAGEVVISDTTLAALTPGATPWKLTTPLGPMLLKGRAEPLALHRVEWSLE
jgi:adenylate cyclase